MIYLRYINNKKYINFKFKNISLTKVRIESKCQLQFKKIKIAVATIIEHDKYKSYRC